MPSIIPGYEYDIFISYRQKDNKGDRWVSEFVDALKTELESTFKEEMSVYFDINPCDGLLETHDVDASLKEKLKCLIFIPIISQTYCDSKSFAWQKELVAFNKLAKEDQFGRDIKLSSGNITSRILPVKIHELDAEDKTLLENELGGVLRSIDFIYKSSGVNRPLRANEDHPQDNLNKTYYRDQINKVANAAKETINAIKKNNQQDKEILKEVVIPEHEHSKKLKPKIIIVSAIMLSLIVLGYFFIPKLFESSKPAEKSIAVLPFRLLSDEPDNQYLADGMMEAITLHLSKIKDLRVMSRTSVEQYRGTTKTTRTIGQELDVAYLLEGSFQKFGDNARLIVQLINASAESHAWANEYNSKWSDVFSLQSEVAQKIASELNAIISPEEKQLIEKSPTLNLTAYDFYQRGKEELWEYNFEGKNSSLYKAVEFFCKALKYDSTFAQAYAGLAGVYYRKHVNEYKSFFTKNYLDSVLILSDRALSFDDHLSEGYFYKAAYYINNGKTEQAIKEFDKALKYNPNYWEAYLEKASSVYFGDLNNSDYVKGLEYIQKAIRVNHGRELPNLFGALGAAYGYYAGFPDKAKYYFQKAFKLDGDTISYLGSIGSLEIQYGDFEIGIEKSLKAYAKDSVEWRLANQYLFHSQYKEALKYYSKFIERLRSLGQIPQGNQQLIGYAYWQNGYKKEAEYWFNEQKRLSLESIKLGRYYSASVAFGSSGYYDLASVYAFTGENEKAYEILRILDHFPIFPLSMVDDIKKYNPLFNSIRNEPEFQQIIKDLEAKYQAEHERVRKWLEEQEKL